MSKERNYNLDVLKTICAFLVICIHVPFPGIVGEIIIPLARIAVPIFFMITGYFYDKIDKKPFKQIKKVIILIILSNLLYFILDAITNKNVAEMFSLKNILSFVVFNESPFAGHLWYLNALLYVLVILYFVDKLKIRKYLYYVIPILLAIDLILGKYSILLFEQQFPYIIIRNFLFVRIAIFSNRKFNPEK